MKIRDRHASFCWRRGGLSTCRDHNFTERLMDFWHWNSPKAMMARLRLTHYYQQQKWRGPILYIEWMHQHQLTFSIGKVRIW